VYHDINRTPADEIGGQIVPECSNKSGTNAKVSGDLCQKAVPEDC